MSERVHSQVKAESSLSITPLRSGLLQRKTANEAEQSTVPPIVHEVLSSPGQPLDSETRAFMEPRFGHDFSQVRVHTDAKAAESARAVDALAYTIGQEVVLGRDHSYLQKSEEGRKLLAHELAHVIQQEKQSPLSKDSVEVSETNDDAERNVDSVINSIDWRSSVLPSATPIDGQRPVYQRGEKNGSVFTGERPPKVSPLGLVNTIQRKPAPNSLSESKVAQDYTDAVDYINSFYSNTERCIHALHLAETTAINDFDRYSRIPDPPDIAEEIAMDLLGSAFELIGGWEIIKKGITNGVFALNISKLRKGLGERIGEQGLDVLSKSEPTEREKAIGEKLVTLVKEAKSVKASAETAQSSAAQSTEVGRTLAQAVSSSEESLGKWGYFSALAEQEQDIAKDSLKSWSQDKKLQGRLLSEIQTTLGAPPDSKTAKLKVVDAAQKYELELYRRRFGKGSGTKLIIKRVSSQLFGDFEKERRIEGGGWSTAIQERVTELFSVQKQTSPDVNTIANWLEVPTEISEQKSPSFGAFQ